MASRSTFGSLESIVTGQIVYQDSDPQVDFTPDPTGLLPAELHIIGLAMADMDGTLDLQRRWRILQMVAQCSGEGFKHLTTQKSPVASNERSQTHSQNQLFLILEELDKTSGDYFMASLHYRMRLLELCSSFHDKVAEHKKKMGKARQERNRMSAFRLPLDPLPDAGKSAKSRAMDEIIGACSDTEPISVHRRLQQRLMTYTDLGACLAFLIVHLGFNILLVLPASTTQPHQFKLLRAIDYYGKPCKPIEPSEYVSMFLFTNRSL
jgi:hypothetical protein